MDSLNTDSSTEIQPQTFVTRLIEFSNVSREKLAWGRLYRDLTFIYAESGIFSYVGKIARYITSSDTFDQIEEFGLALSYVTDEIKQNNFQHLQDPLVKSCLPNVMKNLLFFKLDSRNIEVYTQKAKETLVHFQNKIDVLQNMIFHNMPFLTSPNSFPIIDEDYLFQFYKDNFGIMMKASLIIDSLKDYILKNYKTETDINDSTVDNLQKLVVFSRGIKSIKQRVKDVPRDLPIGYKGILISKIFSCCTTLLTLRYLTTKQKIFLHFIFNDKNLDGNSHQFTKFVCFHKIFSNVKKHASLRITKAYESDPSKDFSDSGVDKFFLNEISKMLRGVETFFIYLLPYLINIMQTPDGLSMLKDIITDPQFFNNLMQRLVDEDNVAKLYRSGFLIPEDENFCISEGWRKIIEIFIPDYNSFLISAFSSPHERVGNYYPELTNREVWTCFSKGSSLQHYPDFLFHKALVEGDQADPLLMSKLLELDQDKTNRIKHLLKTPGAKPTNYLWLILASLNAKNTTYLSLCYSGYATQIQVCFYTKTAWEELNVFDNIRGQPLRLVSPVDISEEIILNTIEHINFKALESKVSSAVIRVKYFPRLTLNGIKIILDKDPTINIEGINVLENDPRYSDFTLSEELVEGQPEAKTKKLYVSLDVLKRSSDYFRGMCASGFKESGTDHAELGKEDFTFFKRWMDVIYQPTNNFYVENITMRERLLYRLKVMGMGVDIMHFCVEQLFLARSYQMNDLFNLLDNVFSSLITITLADKMRDEEKSDFIAMLKRFDKLLKDKTNPSEYVTMIEQLVKSEFIKKFNTLVNVS